MQFALVTNSPTFQIAYVTIHPHSKFTHIPNSPMFQIHPCFQLLPFGRANCNQPLHVCYKDVRKYVNTCKYTEKHHGHGVSMFTHVVGANWNSPTLQFALMLLRAFFPQIALVTNSPMFQIHPCFQLPPFGRANCNQPLHVCFLNVRKYTCKYTKNIMGMVWICLRVSQGRFANRLYRGLCFQTLKNC